MSLKLRPTGLTPGLAWRQKYSPYPAPDRVGQDGPMADYTHTIDRWDEATGENLIERIAGVSDYLVALET